MYWLCIVHVTQHYILRTERRNSACYCGWYICWPLYSKRAKSHTYRQPTIGPIVGWTQATLRTSFIFETRAIKNYTQGCYRNSVWCGVKQVCRGDLSSVMSLTTPVLKMAAEKSLRNISTCLLNYTASHTEDGNLLQTQLRTLELPTRWAISLPAERRSVSQEGLNSITLDSACN